MKISYSTYELTSKKMIRQGALLRIQFSNGHVGYADCHPWPELGDHSLPDQLRLLSANETTSLTKRSIFFAQLDAEARAKKINLLKGKSIPPSHYLIVHIDEDLAIPLSEGFQTFKFKVGKDKEKELACLKGLLPILSKARLDFNFRLTYAEFLSYIQELKEFHEKIEFCEDPFPYNALLWQTTQQSTGLSFALDRHYILNSTSHYRVLKPAIEESPECSSQKLVVTSYLAHPLEQVCAAYTASHLKTKTCGLQSHYAYDKNVFSEELSQKGPHFQAPSGTGFGFDTQLQACIWRSL